MPCRPHGARADCHRRACFCILVPSLDSPWHRRAFYMWKNYLPMRYSSPDSAAYHRQVAARVLPAPEHSELRWRVT